MVDELDISKNGKYKNNGFIFEFIWTLFFRHILKFVYYFRYLLSICFHVCYKNYIFNVLENIKVTNTK